MECDAYACRHGMKCLHEIRARWTVHHFISTCAHLYVYYNVRVCVCVCFALYHYISVLPSLCVPSKEETCDQAEGLASASNEGGPNQDVHVPWTVRVSFQRGALIIVSRLHRVLGVHRFAEVQCFRCRYKACKTAEVVDYVCMPSVQLWPPRC